MDVTIYMNIISRRKKSNTIYAQLTIYLYESPCCFFSSLLAILNSLIWTKLFIIQHYAARRSDIRLLMGHSSTTSLPNGIQCMYCIMAKMGKTSVLILPFNRNGLSWLNTKKSISTPYTHHHTPFHYHFIPQPIGTPTVHSG